MSDNSSENDDNDTQFLDSEHAQVFHRVISSFLYVVLKTRRCMVAETSSLGTFASTP